MKKCISILFISLFTFSSYGQHRMEIRASNNITGLPFSSYPALFYSNVHPGIDLGIQHRINSSEKHQWAVSGNIGLFYHRFSCFKQGAFSVYGRLANRRFLLPFGRFLWYGLYFSFWKLSAGPLCFGLCSFTALQHLFIRY